jgi:hypothetical protein
LQHEPHLTAPIRRPRFRLFLAGCLCILGLLAPAASGQSLHSGLTLAPDVINLELAPGESLNYRVALRSGVNLSRVTLWVDPAISDFIRLQEQLILQIGADQPKNISMIFSVPAGTAPGTYQGVIKFRASNPFSLGTVRLVLRVPEPPSGLSIFTNRADPLFLRAETPQGEIIDLFGRRDDEGLPTALTSIRFRSPGGGVSWADFDGLSRLLRFVDSSGATIKLIWVSPTQALVSALMPGGAQFNTTFEIPSVPGRATNLSAPALAPAAGVNLEGRARRAALFPLQWARD